MSMYRIKHIPTGLYYKKADEDNGNWSVAGQIYVRKPQLPRYIRMPKYWESKGGKIREALRKWQGVERQKLHTRLGGQRHVGISLSDWEIEELQ